MDDNDDTYGPLSSFDFSLAAKSDAWRHTTAAQATTVKPSDTSATTSSGQGVWSGKPRVAF
jgi:hypothetical protein